MMLLYVRADDNRTGITCPVRPPNGGLSSASHSRQLVALRPLEGVATATPAKLVFGKCFDACLG